jgi:hypothetical protein
MKLEKKIDKLKTKSGTEKQLSDLTAEYSEIVNMIVEQEEILNEYKDKLNMVNQIEKEQEKEDMNKEFRNEVHIRTKLEENK